MDEEKSIHEELTAAFQEHEESAEETVVEEPEQSSDRDENGRFIAKGEDKPAETAEPVETAEPEEPAPSDPVELSSEKAPSSWTPAAREKWGAIDPDIRAEIIRREEASANGVRQMQEKIAPAEQLVAALSPVADEARTVGQDPVGYIQSLAISERTLRTSDVPAKFQELMRIADQYGIPLREVINESVGQQVLTNAAPQHTQQVAPQVQQELNEMRQWRESMGQEQANNHVETFGRDKEFFQDVRGQMASMVENGMANDLEEAYSTACWANPSVREVLLTRQGQQQGATAVVDRQKKAAGASIKPKGQLEVPLDDGEDDDIADTVRKAYNSAATGRV